MAMIPGANTLPGLYGIPDMFRIETHEKGFRVFRVSGMDEVPAEIIGNIRYIAKDIFLRIAKIDLAQQMYHIGPFIIQRKPKMEARIVGDTQLSGDIVLNDFLGSLNKEIESLTHLLPFI